MSSVLDDPETYSNLDPDGMLEAITKFPESARAAISNTNNISINITGIQYDSILIAGMGGSAVGGLLLRDWLLDTLKIPCDVSRGYHLPAWVNKKTLVYAVSYSGNTEETISQYMEAVKLGCTVVCFCSGGKIRETSQGKQSDLGVFPKGAAAQSRHPLPVL